MGFNFFKKQVQEPVIVEREVLKPSRFTFAHDDTVRVTEFYLKTELDVLYSLLGPDDVFITGSIPAMDNPETFRTYPVFRMPSTLPATRLVTPKKIMCIGSVVITPSNKIIGICPAFTGKSMEDIYTQFNMPVPDENSFVMCMDRQEVIDIVTIEGDIDYRTFTDSIAISSSIHLICNDLRYSKCK